MNKLSAVAVMMLSLIGCSGEDGQNGKDGSDGQDGTAACSPPPPEYYMILSDYDLAEAFARNCTTSVSSSYALCLSEGGGPENVQACDDKRSQEVTVCVSYYSQLINRTVSRLCGAEISHFATDYAEYVTEDTDGDGLSNYVEFTLRINPCSPNTFGNCFSDADLDGDFDGIPNAVDLNPACDLEPGFDCIPLHSTNFFGLRSGSPRANSEISKKSTSAPNPLCMDFVRYLFCLSMP